MNATTDAGERFLALHRKGDPLIMPNPWDIGTARLFAGLGFEALATSSAAHAFTLGLPDGGTNWTQRMEHCREIVAASDLPVNADLENGKGDRPEAIGESIAEAAETGLAGCSIEDYTNDPANPIYDFDLSVERIAAACEARDRLGRTFVVTARAENHLRGVADLDDTIRRLQAFQEAGADVLYAPALPDMDAIRSVCAAVTKPVNVLAGIPNDPMPTRADLADAGVARISLGSHLAKRMFGALITAGREMREKGTFGFIRETAPTKDIEDLLKG